MRRIGERHDVQVSHMKEFVGEGGRELRNFLSSIANNELRMPRLVCIDDQWVPCDWTSLHLQPFKDRAVAEVMVRIKFSFTNY